MSNTVIKEELVNNSNQPQNELFHINKEIKRLRFERGKINSELTKKIKDYENLRNELILLVFPIKNGDEIITKQMYKIYKDGKMVDKDFLKGKVYYIFTNSIDNSCDIGVTFPIEDDGYITELDSERDGRNDTKMVSLDRFNELYEVVKN